MPRHKRRASKCNISAYEPSYVQMEDDRDYYRGKNTANSKYVESYDTPLSSETDYTRSFSTEVYEDHYPAKQRAPELKYADYNPSEETEDEDLSEEVYIVRQNYGYCSILFSLAQTIILIIMMVKCGVAPIKVNPMIGPYPDVLSEWGGKNTVLILEDNEWWRLLTPVLLHAGVIHLLANVAVQLETGVFFEKEWGSARWLAIYLASGLGSSILSVICMPSALSVGSSGAVMGLFGGKLSEVVMRACERVRTKQDKVGHQVRKEQCCAVTCSVVVIMLFSFIPYVDWAAHLGGLASGIIIGIFIFACEIESCLWRVAWSMVGMAATVISFTMALDYMYSGNVEAIEELRDVCQYYKDALQEDYECVCQRGNN